jgi:hypothetical protein
MGWKLKEDNENEAYWILIELDEQVMGWKLKEDLTGVRFLPT